MQKRKIYWAIITIFSFICIIIGMQMKEHQGNVKQYKSEHQTTITKTQIKNQSKDSQQNPNEIITVENPNDIEVVVNKNRKLPEGYAPSLVIASIRRV